MVLHVMGSDSVGQRGTGRVYDHCWAFDLALLWIVYRKFSLWLVHASALTLSMLGLVATLKLFHVSINLLNTLAFPLVLAMASTTGSSFWWSAGAREI